MIKHAQRILAERKQKIDEAAKIAFAEAIVETEKSSIDSARIMEKQYIEHFGEPFTRIRNKLGLTR